MPDFVQTLMEMRSGEVAVDVNRKFGELLASVLETGKKGKLTLSVEVSPSKFAMGGAVLEVETRHNCKVTRPELEVGRSLFFVTKDGSLTRDDPAQVAMFEEQRQKENLQRG